MADLKLGKLPDRVPVKLTISIPPELKHALDEYAAVYAATYGQQESVADLIPFMLSDFLDSDRAFLRSRRGQAERSDGRP